MLSEDWLMSAPLCWQYLRYSVVTDSDEYWETPLCPSERSLFTGWLETGFADMEPQALFRKVSLPRRGLLASVKARDQSVASAPT